MHKLRYYLGLGENHDLNAVIQIAMVKAVSKGTLEVLSFHLKALEDVLRR